MIKELPKHPRFLPYIPGRQTQTGESPWTEQYEVVRLQLCRPAIQSQDGPSNPALQTQSPDVWLQERVLLLLHWHRSHNTVFHSTTRQRKLKRNPKIYQYVFIWFNQLVWEIGWRCGPCLINSILYIQNNRSMEHFAHKLFYAINKFERNVIIIKECGPPVE